MKKVGFTITEQDLGTVWNSNDNYYIMLGHNIDTNEMVSPEIFIQDHYIIVHKRYENIEEVSDTSHYMVRPSYAYSWNTQERVDEIAGPGNHYTAKYWEYDSRLGRRWNIDPVVKPWESGYSVMGNNPIWNIDHEGDDFINVHTNRKKAAKGKRDEAEKGLIAALQNLRPFEGMSRKDARAAGTLDEFRTARKELKSAKKSFERADDIYQQEIEYEAIVNDVLDQFKAVNPDKYAEWEKFDPTGEGILDIEVNATKSKIYRYDASGNRIGTTTESIYARWRYGDRDNSFVKVRLRIQKIDDKIIIRAMTGNLVHGLGHIDGGKERDEDYARQYQTKHFDNHLKK